MSVEHAQVASSFFQVLDSLDNWVRTIIRSEYEVNFTRLCDNIVLAAILITECVSSNNNGGGPSRHETRDVGNDNWFSKNCSVQDVTDSSVGTAPHFLESEFLDTTFIRGNSCAFDSNLGSLHSFSAVDGDLIVCGISTLDRKIVVFKIYINVGVDMLQIKIRLSCFDLPYP